MTIKDQVIAHITQNPGPFTTTSVARALNLFWRPPGDEFYPNGIVKTEAVDPHIRQMAKNGLLTKEIVPNKRQYLYRKTQL